MKKQDYYSLKDLKNLKFKKIGTNLEIKKSVKFFFSENIEIGNNVRIEDYSIITGRGGVKIGNYVQISSHSCLLGKFGIELGNYVTLAPGVKIFSGSDDYYGHDIYTSFLKSKNFLEKNRGKIKIKDYVIIGANSVVMPNLIINEGVAIGALSFVNKSLKDWNIYYGTKIKKSKKRSKKFLKQIKKIL
tara:strand:- start:50 stop:613 length:564 start_codon:yes stop_codon:yes gene_type:complete